MQGANGFVIADIPGLIEGASEGIGLGHEFLRHIERTKMMIHVVDAAGSEGRDPVDDIHKINAELHAYNAEIASRPQVIAANKIDLIYDDGESENPVERLKKEFEPQGIKVFLVLQEQESKNFFIMFLLRSRSWMLRQLSSSLSTSQMKNLLIWIFHIQLRKKTICI